MQIKVPNQILHSAGLFTEMLKSSACRDGQIGPHVFRLGLPYESGGGGKKMARPRPTRNSNTMEKCDILLRVLTAVRGGVQHRTFRNVMHLFTFFQWGARARLLQQLLLLAALHILLA